MGKYDDLNQVYKPNETALALYGVTLDDYFDWCKERGKAPYKASTKKDFFTRLREHRLVKIDGKLVRKNRKRK